MVEIASVPSGYLRRVVDDELDVLFAELAAIALDGPKGVGKTRTAEQRAGTAHPLDDPAVLDLIRADPRRLLDGQPPLLIDEWQRYPPSWDLVRRAVDAHPQPGRFLLTGSRQLADPDTHSGAGRIVQLRMRPLALSERGLGPGTVSLRELLTGARPAVTGATQVTLEVYAREICASGFPGMRGLSARAGRAQLDGYIARVVDRDFPETGSAVRNEAAVRRWMAAYAAASSSTASYDTIRDAATPGDADKPARTTVLRYRDVLERLWLLDPVPAWQPTKNHLRRAGAAPKHQLADPALAARLLGVDAAGLVEATPATPVVARDTTLLGQLFESLVTLSVRVYAQAAEASVGHLRTHQGEREVDLIVHRQDQRAVAIEVKMAATPSAHDVRHLHWLQEQMGDDLLDAVIVTTGTDAYRRQDGIVVVPAALLGP